LHKTSQKIAAFRLGRQLSMRTPTWYIRPMPS
jgi:hypothetical protein